MQFGSAEYEVKRSTFIGYCKPVSTPEEATAFVEEIKKKHSDARHNVYAWVLKKNTNLQKYSDDGEPSGTAGLPVMSVLTKNELSDLAVVVTRYFGGILLGKGGLVRAYTKAASEAVKAAVPVSMQRCAVFKTEIDYKGSEKLIFELNGKGWKIRDIEYSDHVSFYNDIPLSKSEEFLSFVFDCSMGKITPLKVAETDVPMGADILFEAAEEEDDET